jgi:hypothetical protein
MKNGNDSMKVETTGLTSIVKRKRYARQKLAALPFDRKLEALISLQKTARDMVKASGRHFNGIVWHSKTN